MITIGGKAKKEDRLVSHVIKHKKIVWAESNADCFMHRQIEKALVSMLKDIESFNDRMLEVLWELNNLE